MNELDELNEINERIKKLDQKIKAYLSLAERFSFPENEKEIQKNIMLDDYSKLKQKRDELIKKLMK
ncbi:hypothetical protein [Bacteroides ihuae]|uniref:hypothetical protein n=1 Tax=Bacteroides ihuae TaxID=1852362 RepID=UPI0008D93E2C|nr:hypothetical protein [Bacteroides ihuae]